jgi:predicted secreted protein
MMMGSRDLPIRLRSVARAVGPPVDAAMRMASAAFVEAGVREVVAVADGV